MYELSFFNVRAFDEDCGRLISEVFTVTRDDTIVPTIVSGPMDMTVECDNIPEVAGPEAVVATDNCGEEVTVDPAIELGPFPGSCMESTRSSATGPLRICAATIPFMSKPSRFKTRRTHVDMMASDSTECYKSAT